MYMINDNVSHAASQENFKPTWLYIKQHNKTGLKYFGKTLSKNPERYKGSGVYWRRHLKIHGNDVTTIWLQLFTTYHELIDYAVTFSATHNIVESTEWANLIPETGEDGGSNKGQGAGVPKSAIHRRRLSEAKRGIPATVTQLLTLQRCREERIYTPLTDETKNKLRVKMLGRKPSASTVQKLKFRKQEYLTKTQRIYNVVCPNGLESHMDRLTLTKFCTERGMNYASLVAKSRLGKKYMGYFVTVIG